MSTSGHHVLVFDSGVGGLSVVSEIRARLPRAYLSYVADDAFRPYGSKTEAQLRARLPGLLATLTEMLDPAALVIACNTASTTALPPIRAKVKIPVIGVVPAIKPAAERSVTAPSGFWVPRALCAANMSITSSRNLHRIVMCYSKARHGLWRKRKLNSRDSLSIWMLCAKRSRRYLPAVLALMLTALCWLARIFRCCGMSFAPPCGKASIGSIAARR